MIYYTALGHKCYTYFVLLCRDCVFLQRGFDLSTNAKWLGERKHGNLGPKGMTVMSDEGSVLDDIFDMKKAGI